jgi:hypothetical protein
MRCAPLSCWRRRAPYSAAVRSTERAPLKLHDLVAIVPGTRRRDDGAAVEALHNKALTTAVIQPNRDGVARRDPTERRSFRGGCRADRLHAGAARGRSSTEAHRKDEACATKRSRHFITAPILIALRTTTRATAARLNSTVRACPGRITNTGRHFNHETNGRRGRCVRRPH